MSSIHDILADIQTRMVAPKNSWNDFGKYKYRNVDSILQALKPFLLEHKCTILMTDKIEFAEGRVYVQATVTLSNGTDSISSTALARESLSKKGMDESQITGSASSYARKYALSGLFALDDGKDADSDNNTEKPKNPEDKKEVKTEKTNPITETDKKEMAKMNIKIENLAKYLQCKPEEITHDQIVKAIKSKKEALMKIKEAENGKIQ